MKRTCSIGMQSLIFITIESLMETFVVVKIQQTVTKQSLQFHSDTCMLGIVSLACTKFGVYDVAQCQYFYL